ncbi:MAG: N-formylglutamate deformylase [Gammaproteobacteria bacterium]|nr:N-formylglutamate deformylase [Gammaproteobacteria bacterium]
MSDAPAIAHYLPSRGEEIALLASIPHTGLYLPPDIAAQFATPAMGTGVMADWHLHELYAFLPALGIDVLHATHHRFVVDLNRPPDATPLYPGRFETALVPTETFQGEPIWSVPPDAAQIERRREQFHRPYHAALEQRLREKVQRFGRCYLIDLHSVESRASRLHGRLQQDVYLGDRDGKTCDPWFTALVADLFAQQGLKVSLNNPYKGGYITAHYSHPNGGPIDAVQTLQVEMCQYLYMTEGEPAGAPGQPRFAAFAAQLRAVFTALADAVRAPHQMC